MNPTKTRSEGSRAPIQRKGTISTRSKRTVPVGDREEIDDTIDEEMLRARVRQRIQQRLQQLESTNTATVTGERTAPFMIALHQDVVQTAAQILGKYLTHTHPTDEPLELALVHRLLMKEVELQALQQQRMNAH